uniref:Polyprotein n=1 Tax=Oryza sativa subsp. japonica TaxID=39947 RepID=Q5W6M8_ORYSJ|nr:putative polyprotein [Oryza sativa Japonica Group]
MEEDEAEDENIPDWAQYAGFEGNQTGEVDRDAGDNDAADDLGCDQGHKKLDTTLEFLQWKAKNGVSDKAFGDLLKLVKNILPEGNKLPETTYKAKKIVCPLGLEVQKIHACPNDCILYRSEEYENLEACPDKQEEFNLRALLFVTINDWPALSNLSEQFNKGYKACTHCMDETGSTYLKHCRKVVYMGHRRFLAADHLVRKKDKHFEHKADHRTKPKHRSGKTVFAMVKDLKVVFGNGPGSQPIESEDGHAAMWKKNFIFWELPYWEFLDVRHAIDVMHLIKNLCVNLLGFLGVYGKSKDTLEARTDLKHMKQRGDLHPEPKEKGSHYLSPTSYTLVTTGINPAGVPYRCPSTPDFVHLHPCTFVYNQTEPQTKPYPLDMWKYGSALQQRPEDWSLYGRAEGEGRADWVHGSGAHAAASRSTVHRVHPGSHRPAPWAPHVSRTRGHGRLTAGPHAAATRRARRRPCRHGRREAVPPRPDGCRRRPPARRSGGRERGGKGERRRRSTAHPGATAATEEAAGAEGGGGATRVDGDGGAPAVGDRNGGVDEVGEDAAKLKEAAPRWEAVRGDDGGRPELDGDGGERERCRELESGEEEGRREAETDGGNNVRATITKLCAFMNAISQKVIDPDRLEAVQNDVVDVLYMGVLKKYVRNRARPEASIAKGYETEEVIEFCVQFIEGLRPIGAHFTVLQQSSLVAPYIEEHLALVRARNIARNDRYLSACQQERVVGMGRTTRMHGQLSGLPQRWRLSVKDSGEKRASKGYEINGYTFYTRAQDMKSTNQNSAVHIDALGHDDTTGTYYGAIEDIWELDYGPLKVPLFRCQWVRLTGGGVTVDDSGMTTVDLNKVGYSDEPFILANDVTQVFYVKDMSSIGKKGKGPDELKRHVVLPDKRKIVGVEDKTDEDYDQFDGQPPFTVTIDPSILLSNEDTPYSRSDHKEGTIVRRKYVR